MALCKQDIVAVFWSNKIFVNQSWDFFLL